MQIDARNKSCPQSVILATKALDQLAAQGQAGQELEVLANEMVAVENLKRLAASHGRAVEVVEGAGEWSVRIAGGEAPAEDSASAGEGASAFEAVCDLPATQSSPLATVAHGAPVVVAVGDDVIGRGDKELGRILLKGIIYAFANADVPPAKMVFFNDGAKVTCEGSPSIDDLRELEARGCEILTCGTCLDFHGLKEKLAVGGITNLYAISQILLSGGVVSL